ncbi:LysR family transcriptional regulator [Vibrio nitrifigilis]|uniref:LysR family transcriptional regulator n=1 Tax=Vibrio nitrifigilis TaxID=2789781 RepID=A0ABS0GL54_9VIBR|nr:LysR family transcriptional regulator [Vibrio nitrifigilis]MBF9003204.1 LysR family transcriptional regulator [Vibrio nitrifigilis]
MANIKNLDLNLLRVFDTLMDEKNVSRAAEKLSVSQPAVSGMMTRLRHSLGDQLFIRSQHGIVPTVRAQELSGPIKKLLRELDAVLEPTLFDPRTAELTLSIAATDYSLRAIVEPFLLTFKQQAPNIKVSVRWINEHELFEQMERGIIDIALTTPEASPVDLRAKTLFDETYICVLRDDHPLLEDNTLTLEQFCSIDHAIVSYVGGAFEGMTDQVLHSLGKQRRVVLSVPSFLSLVNILKNSDLCAVVPRRLITNIQGLTTVNLPFEVPGFTKIMAWHERTHDSDAHRWIRDSIVKLCNEL